jgi:hypothetical protein
VVFNPTDNQSNSKPKVIKFLCESIQPTKFRAQSYQVIDLGINSTHFRAGGVNQLDFLSQNTAFIDLNFAYAQR